MPIYVLDIPCGSENTGENVLPYYNVSDRLEYFGNRHPDNIGPNGLAGHQPWLRGPAICAICAAVNQSRPVLINGQYQYWRLPHLLGGGNCPLALCGRVLNRADITADYSHVLIQGEVLWRLS
jgi:hypothetical protein